MCACVHVCFQMIQQIPEGTLLQVLGFLDPNSLVQCSMTSRHIEACCLLVEDQVYERYVRQREFDQMEDNFSKAGFVVGVDDGRVMRVQEGFDLGYKREAEDAATNAYYEGAIAALGIFTDQHIISAGGESELKGMKAELQSLHADYNRWFVTLPPLPASLNDVASSTATASQGELKASEQTQPSLAKLQHTCCDYVEALIDKEAAQRLHSRVPNFR